MALRTSNGTGGGNWGTAATWDTGVPVDTDTFKILNGDTVTFNVDQTGWTGLGASTIDAGGTLIASTTAGAYVLKMTADLTVNGTLQAGTSVAVPYPATCTFTVDFSATASSIVVSNTTGVIKLYCTEPTYKYVTLTAVEPATETVIAYDNSTIDLTTDIWAATDTVAISDILPRDTELATISAVADGTITLTAGLSAQKQIGSKLVLCTRNIRILNSTDAAGTINSSTAISSTTGNHIAAYINGVSGIYYVDRTIFGGTIIHTTAHGSYGCSYATYDCCIVNNANTGATAGLDAIESVITTTESLICGGSYGVWTSINSTFYGKVSGVTYAYRAVNACSIVGDIEGIAQGILYSGSTYLMGNVANASTSALYGNNSLIVSNCELGKSIGGVVSANVAAVDKVVTFYNVLFSATTEYASYNSDVDRGQFLYSESTDHDQNVNAYKAWCLGGIVTSQTASPPTGYTIWYEHACEYVSTGSYPCFRQYETTVLPHTTIEVDGKIRIADGEDLSTDPPALQIIDKFADPLVDATQSPLAEDEIPDPSGAETDWQDVSVWYANTGDSPKQVIVRMYASVAGVAANVDVDECWAIATYIDQIAEIYKKIKRLGPTGETA